MRSADIISDIISFDDKHYARNMLLCFAQPRSSLGFSKFYQFFDCIQNSLEIQVNLYLSSLPRVQCLKIFVKYFQEKMNSSFYIRIFI